MPGTPWKHRYDEVAKLFQARMTARQVAERLGVSRYSALGLRYRLREVGYELPEIDNDGGVALKRRRGLDPVAPLLAYHERQRAIRPVNPKYARRKAREASRYA